MILALLISSLFVQWLSHHCIYSKSTFLESRYAAVCLSHSLLLTIPSPSPQPLSCSLLISHFSAVTDRPHQWVHTYTLTHYFFQCHVFMVLFHEFYNYRIILSSSFFCCICHDDRPYTRANYSHNIITYGVPLTTLVWDTCTSLYSVFSLYISLYSIHCWN